MCTHIQVLKLTIFIISREVGYHTTVLWLTRQKGDLWEQTRNIFQERSSPKYVEVVQNVTDRRKLLSLMQ